jgi:hypothetical protein
VILVLQENLEFVLRILSIPGSDGGILEVEESLQTRTDEPGDGRSRVLWKSLCGRNNVTYWMSTIRETHDIWEVTKQGNEHTDPAAPLHKTD